MLMQFGFYMSINSLVYKEERMIFHFGQFIRDNYFFHNCI